MMTNPDKTPGNNNCHSHSIVMLLTWIPVTILVLCVTSGQVQNKYRSRSGIFLLNHGIQHRVSDRRLVRDQQHHRKKQGKQKNRKRKSWKIKKKEKTINRNYKQGPRIDSSCTCGITADLVQVCKIVYPRKER